jgi:type IV pilus assembly protein PilF
LQRLHLVSFLLSLALVSACASSKNPGVRNPEKASEAEYDLSREYFYKGQPRIALEHCKRAIDLNDQNAKAVYFASTLHLYFCSGKLGLSDPDCRLADAETYARRALQILSSFREAQNTLGQILILEKRYPEAMAILEPLTKDPSFESSYLAWGNYGWAQVLAGQVDAGIESLKNSITEPRFCVGHYRLGVAYERRGDLASAEQALTDAVSVDAPACKNLQDAWLERAEVRMKLARVADAKADFEKCRDISPDTLAGKNCVDALGKMQ